MDTVKEKVEELLRENGAVLVRSKKHKVYRLPDGRMFTTASSPSDSHAWNNCLRALKNFLGQRSSNKTHADFEHRKKENDYSKPVEHRKEFLAGLPEREERPPTPLSESPLVWLKRKQEAEKKAQEEEALKKPEIPDKEVFDIGGHWPPAGTKKYHRSASGRSGPVVHYSQEKIAELNLGLSSITGRAVPQLRAEQNFVPLYFKEEVMDVAHGVAASSEGTLEAALRNAKQEVERHRAAEITHRMEVQRFEQIVQALEQAVKLATAPRASLKNFAPSSNGTGESQATLVRRPYGFVTSKIKEILATSPLPLDRKGLQDEVLKEIPDSKKESIYQAIHKGMLDGWLYEDAEKHIFIKQ